MILNYNFYASYCHFLNIIIFSSLFFFFLYIFQKLLIFFLFLNFCFVACVIIFQLQLFLSIHYKKRSFIINESYWVIFLFHRIQPIIMIYSWIKKKKLIEIEVKKVKKVSDKKINKKIFASVRYLLICWFKCFCCCCHDFNSKY